MTNAIILSIGDELILGQSVDTNSAWLSGELAGIGIKVTLHITVSDDQHDIERAISESSRRANLLIITGGIGPTPDDLTRQALAAVLQEELIEDAAALQTLEAFFKSRNRPMSPNNRIQVQRPASAKFIDNPLGTAPGISAQIKIDSHLCKIFVMPGVPKEMKGMFSETVLPQLRELGGGGVILSATLHTFGRGESVIAQELGELMRRDRNPSVGTTVSNGIVSLRINSKFNSRDEAQLQLDETIKQCYVKLGELIYGRDEQTLQEVVAAMLIEKKLTVTTAESCTGGLLAKMLTDVPGSSEFFKMGFITYSNKAKYERLGVSTEVINVYGAVSENVVHAMAANAKRLAKASIALSISGVAGPGGGSPTKPVGTVCIGFAHPDGVITKQFNFPGDREWVRDRSAKMALTMLRYKLLDREIPF